MESEEALTIYAGPEKMALALLGSLAFVALNVWLIAFTDATFLIPRAAAVVVAWVGVLFFGFCAARAVWHLLAPKPIVIIDDKGILDNASLLGAGFIPWDEIAEVGINELLGQRSLGIVPVDIEGVLARQNALKRCLMKMNTGLLDAPFNIPEAVLPMSLETLVDHMSRHAEAAGGDVFRLGDQGGTALRD